MRGSLILWVAAIGWLGAPLALAFLFVRRRVRTALYFLAGMVGWPAVMWLLWGVEDTHSRMWLSIPFIMFAPVWLMLGLGACSAAYDAANGARPKKEAIISRGPEAKARRMKGVIVLAVGLVAWTYGFVQPPVSNGRQVLLLAVALYGLLIGGYWTVLGRGMNDVPEKHHY